MIVAMDQTEHSTPPGVIPYVEAHDGPRRVITVRLVEPSSPLSGMTTSMVMPNVFVDGRQYIVYWGTVSLEAPADRAVHLAVGMQDGLRGASVLLPPSSAPVVMEYKVGSMGRPYFGPPQPG